MSKPIVFISHITEEKELAISLKKLIEESFLGMIDVFVSSDENSIAVGAKWLDNISDALGSCVIELILCSPTSVKRPWINFEAGAGWVRGIPVIPLCHSGMVPSNLPMPLNMLQAIRLNEGAGLKLILPILASAIGSVVPKVDLEEFLESTIRFEGRYMFASNFMKIIRLLNLDMEQIYNYLDNNATVLELTIQLGTLKSDQINKLKNFEQNELNGYIKVESKNPGLMFTSNESFTGATVDLIILDCNILLAHRDLLSNL